MSTQTCQADRQICAEVGSWVRRSQPLKLDRDQDQAEAKVDMVCAEVEKSPRQRMRVRLPTECFLKRLKLR